MDKFLSMIDKGSPQEPASRSTRPMADYLANGDPVIVSLADIFANPFNYHRGAPDTGWAGGPGGVSIHHQPGLQELKGFGKDGQ